MKAVFFSEELHARAPSAIGAILTDTGRWVSLGEVAAALVAGECVDIRQATASELRRAEAFVEVAEIGQQLSKNLQILYQNKGQDAVEDAIFTLHHAVTSANFADIIFVDNE